MIAYNEGNRRFSYRIAGVAVDAGRVLLHRMETDEFWALPGGHVELMELAEESLRREMLEEIGVQVTVGRLLWVAETFFGDRGQLYHQLGLYFSMDLPADSPWRQKDSFWGIECLPGPGKRVRLIFAWHPLSTVPNLPVYPSFLRQSLLSLPAATQHIVHYDE